jgi:hypothetical protein
MDSTPLRPDAVSETEALHLGRTGPRMRLRLREDNRQLAVRVRAQPTSWSFCPASGGRAGLPKLLSEGSDRAESHEFLA